MASRGIRVVHKKRGNRRSGSSKMGRLGEMIFFATFFVVGLVGLALIFAFVIIPELRSAREFVETLCVVKDKRIAEPDQTVQDQIAQDQATPDQTAVAAEETDNKPKAESRKTYRPEINIEYEVDGKTYSIWTYDIAGVYSTGREAKQEIIDNFKIGETYVCWYDPHQHETAVLVKGFSWFGILIALIPLSFLLIGGGGLVYGMFHWGKSAERRAAIALRTQRRRERLLRKSGLAAEGLGVANLPNVPRCVDMASSPGNTYPFRLPVSVLPAWKLIGLLAACLIWNGIVAVLLTIVIRSFINGDPEWAMGLCMLLFIACGGFLIFLLVKQFLIATGIGVTFIEMSAHPLVPGSRYDFLLHQAGRLRVNKLEAVLVCRERAQYQQGTDTRTEDRIVFEQSLFVSKDFEVHHHKPFETKESFEVPEGAMHSFVADNNEVSWSIEVRGDVARWPDFTRTFPVIVHPARRAAATIRIEMPTADKQADKKLAALKRLG